MELQFNPKGINENHERYREGERKRVAKVKKKEQYELEAKYRTRRIMVGVLGTAALAGLIIGTNLIGSKLADNVYKTYGQATGVMRHPETHQLVNYWEIDETGKKYYMEDLKFKALFEKSANKTEEATNYTSDGISFFGETKPLK